MPENKDDKIIEELKRRAADHVRYGTMVVEFKVHDGKITSGEVVEEKIKLG